MSKGKSFTIRDIEQLAASGLIRGYTEPEKGQSGANPYTKGEKAGKGRRKSKYGAEKTEVDGIAFDSAKEARRYTELKILLKAGEIAYLELQVPFALSVCTYVADFTYLDARTGERVVEDVKSRFTAKLPVYRMKKKLMLKELGIKIKEV
jgi:hypothetical protein